LNFGNMNECQHNQNQNQNEHCNMSQTFPAEIKKEMIRYLIGLSGSIIIVAIAFYFQTRNVLASHESELQRITRQIESKADQAAIEKRLDRMENKLDNLIEFQIKK